MNCSWSDQSARPAQKQQPDQLTARDGSTGAVAAYSPPQSSYSSDTSYSSPSSGYSSPSSGYSSPSSGYGPGNSDCGRDLFGGSGGGGGYGSSNSYGGGGGGQGVLGGGGGLVGSIFAGLDLNLLDVKMLGLGHIRPELVDGLCQRASITILAEGEKR
jgi:hypothetical protein